MHRTLARAFAVDEESLPRVLWRLELDATWTNPEVMVQAMQPGNWAVLEALSGYLARPAESKKIMLGDLLRSGDRYRFRVRANPTVYRSGRRFGLVGEDHQVSWLEKKGAQHGFQVESSLVTGTEVLRAFKRSKPVTLRAVTFDGYLKCTDVSLLENAIANGVGRGKAFGMGLLSVARARSR